MYESQSTSFVIAAIVFFFLSATRGEMPIQHLTRDELVQFAGYGEEKLSSVLVMGTLVCEACPKSGSELHTSHIAGAKMAVSCKTEGKRNNKRANWAYATTDDYGEFMIDLPSHLHAIPRIEDSCVVRILGVPRKSRCHRRGLRTIPRRIRLSSIGNSIRVYSTGTVKLNDRSWKA
ncbi:uncharacterized protein A4U43_C08F20740 [Asparagus officinalis]|uniref:uncharacterized protein LOC109820356 n=1 Tax=Asparagus officinalis TaxID=4686 RepID=UPI00098E1387|nr:uncharacterized protein LOC109820356 [Asparagus officinalis]ONK60629.1 uncharacterized protein A4U43_C08F20740 [Asparagus officinalis]